MANISDKTNMSNHTGVVNETGVAGANWISQINAGGIVYDIATHHGITFREGSGGATTTWNGLSDIEVVIPSITDIVQTPIEFVGVVGANGEIDWKNGHSAPAKAGNLVFIASDCTFNSIACEAGDMAIYDGEKWNVVTGENQVNIVAGTSNVTENNRTTIAVGSVKDVLTVEGKALALTLDYADLDKHVSVSETGGSAVSVEFGDITVDAVNLKLEKADDVPTSIGKDTIIKNATALKDGTVTLVGADSLVKSVNFGTFTQGTLPTFTPNSEKKLTIAGGTLNVIEGSDFVKSVSLADVTFVDADASDANKITMLTGINSGAGASFLNEVHLTGEKETADITIAGSYAPESGASTKFVEGLIEGSEVLTGYTAGTFKLTTGNDLVTGFAEGSDEVIGSVTATVNNDTEVLASASVTNHVLSFTPTNVASSVNVTTTPKKLELTKTSFTYTPTSFTKSGFTTSGFTKSDDVKYTFGKGNETVYTPDTKMWKLNTPELEVKTGAYQINHTNMKATIDAGSFVASATEGSLPTWSGYDAPTVTVTGTVGTALTTKDVTVKELTTDSITIPGAYSLKSVTTGGDVTVGAAGASVTINESTVNLAGYLTDVDVTIVKDPIE